MRTLALPFVLILCCFSHQAFAESNWNQFRGPTEDGVVESKTLPVEWSESKNVKWKTAIHGKAWSSPVVWDEKIWLTTATPDGKVLSAICVDAKSGSVLRDIVVFEIEEPMFCHAYNSYASSTPVIEEGRLWVHYGSAGTACLDTKSGKILWTRQDFPCNHHRGPGSSPIIFRDLLIVNFDGYDLQYVVALNKNMGETVWKVDRNIDYKTSNGDAKKAYCTPTVIEHEGRLQLVNPSAVATVSYNPLTGDELWKVYHGGFNAAARPLYRHGMVYLNTEGGLRLLAVRPDGEGDVTDTHIVWRFNKSTPTRPSQLILGDHMYMVNDKGVATCLNAKTGESMWTHRMAGAHTASPILSGKRIYFFDEAGVGHVVEASPKSYQQLAENRLDSGCMASPAVIDDALIVRTKTHLYRIQE